MHNLTDIPYNADQKKNLLGKTVSKSGVEIKASLKTLIIQMNMELNKIDSEIGVCKEKLDEAGLQPKTEMDYYNDYKFLLSQYKLPNKFSWSEIDNDIQGEQGKVTRQLMREWNEKIDKYFNVLIDRLKVETLLRNLDDKKDYDLSINQLTILGL